MPRRCYCRWQTAALGERERLPQKARNLWLCGPLGRKPGSSAGAALAIRADRPCVCCPRRAIVTPAAGLRGAHADDAPEGQPSPAGLTRGKSRHMATGASWRAWQRLPRMVRVPRVPFTDRRHPSVARHQNGTNFGTNSGPDLVRHTTGLNFIAPLADTPTVGPRLEGGCAVLLVEVVG